MQPAQHEAYRVLHLALDAGVLSRADRCQRCGASDVRIHGHHSDYGKPLDVQWLCAPCHRVAHSSWSGQAVSWTRPSRIQTFAHIEATIQGDGKGS